MLALPMGGVQPSFFRIARHVAADPNTISARQSVECRTPEGAVKETVQVLTDTGLGLLTPIAMQALRQSDAS
jgi:hypothetical protein